jgi:hypothetical protein
VIAVKKFRGWIGVLPIALALISCSSILDLSVSPNSVNFESTTTGKTTTQTVTATNSGTGNISLSSLRVTGTGFSSSGITLPVTLAPGQSARFNVVFAPSTAGSFSGTATLTSTASDSPLNIELAGSATVRYRVLLSMTYGSSAAVGFNVYRGEQSGGPYARLNSDVISAMTYTDSSVDSGQTYYYVATEVDSAGNESSYSDQVTMAIP